MKTERSKFLKEIVLHGRPTSPGVAIGSAFQFHSPKINLNELKVKSTDIMRELDFFSNAILKVAQGLEISQKASERQYGDQFSEIFESQKAFLKDPVLIKEIEEEIKKSGFGAAFVVSKILAEKGEYFINLESAYFRDRAYDILDLKQQLIHALLGIDTDYRLDKPSIVVAEMLSPSDTVQFNRNFILGFLTDKGGENSHAAILARGLRIPAVVYGHSLSRLITPGSQLILDGFNGGIIINPTPETIARYEDIQKEHQRFEHKLLAELKLPAQTKDGTEVSLLANIEFAHEVTDVKQNHAQGVGLFRTESMFIEKGKLPSEEEQFTIYRQIAEQLDPNPATIRTIDLGGDKFLDNYSQDDELNPFMGWRAIRFCLDEPEIFKTQLRAILRAGMFGNIHILIPMISSVDEIIRTKELIKEAEDELLRKGTEFKAGLPLGIMIETPAAAIMAEELAAYVDFFSIGTNDLTQYVLAIDRTNDKVSRAYNTFNPAVLKFIERTIQAGVKHKKPVTLCGEFAANPVAIPLLLGMQLRNFSMNPHYIAEAKKIVRSVDLQACNQLYTDVQSLHTADAIEEKCRALVKANVPNLEFLS